MTTLPWLLFHRLPSQYLLLVEYLRVAAEVSPQNILCVASCNGYWLLVAAPVVSYNCRIARRMGHEV